MTKRLLLLIAGLSLWLFLPQARGQTLFTASLDGSQETPAVTTSGQATAWALPTPGRLHQASISTG